MIKDKSIIKIKTNEVCYTGSKSRKGYKHEGKYQVMSYLSCVRATLMKYHVKRIEL